MNNLNLTTSQIYNCYDLIIRQVEKWIDSKNIHVHDCEDAQVKARIVQRITEATNEAHTEQSINYVNKFSKPLPYLPKIMHVDGLSICTQTGKVSASIQQWLQNIFLFAASWLYLFTLLAISLFKKSPQHSSSATLLMEAGDGYGNSDFNLIRFCRQGPIDPLSSAKNIIIRTKTPPRNRIDSSFHYDSEPLTYLASNFLKRSVRFNLLLRHLTAPFYYLKALINFPLNIIISRDLAFIPISSLLNKKKLIEAIFLTTSHFSSQPLWMMGLKNQQFKLQMIWYAQNFIPHTFIDEQEPTHLPYARHIRVNVHWVWTESFKTYLKQLGQRSEIRVVGPLLWYLPEQEVKLDDGNIKIALFDVTPIVDGKRVYGGIRNYYSVSTMKKFITDIVEICSEISTLSGKQIFLLLKQKRPPKVGHHNAHYLEFLNQTLKAAPHLKLIDPQSNLFTLLSQCSLSISIPYTSTAYVAASVYKPTIYYDPSRDLLPTYDKNEFVHFASGSKELKVLIERLLNLSKVFHPVSTNIEALPHE